MNIQIACICPPKGDAPRHPDGDTVTLRETLGFRAVAAARWTVEIARQLDPHQSLAEQFGTLTEIYVLEGIESWSLVDKKGQPIEVSKAAIREHLLPRSEAQIVGDAADRKYLEVMLPLLRGESTSSQPTPTTESTSPQSGSSEKTPRPSKRSLTSITPTADTETTSNSLDGVSSSSQSSVSAA